MSKNESLTVSFDSNYSDTGCDETKCVSNGLKWLYELSLTCYSNDDRFPMACSDGYRARLVDSEPVFLSEELKVGTSQIAPSMPFHYFTCCPPDLPLDTNITRDCSDPIRVINDEATDICEDDTTRPYPRKLANDGPTEFHICCDSVVSNNNKTSFLNDTECVPFHDTFFSPTIIENRYGNIPVVMCDNIGIYKLFQYPREVVKDNDNHYGILQYKCCKTESTNELPPFVRDSAFKKTVYPQIVVSTIAVFSLLLFIVALLIPLFLYLKKKRNQTTNATTTTTTRTRRNNNTRTNRGQQNPPGSTYNCYVLYLVYLAIVDLIMNMSLLIVFGKMANQKLANWSSLLMPIIISCSTANLYINCIISNEILNLLRNSNNVARSRPPSLLKVTIQAMVVYLFSALVGGIYYVVENAQFQEHDTSELEYQAFGTSELYRYKLTGIGNTIWSVIVSVAIPIMFFCYVWITIWYHGYVKMTSVNSATKQLMWYFLRIFIVFYTIWLPGLFFTIFGGSLAIDFGTLAFIGFFFCGIQPIVSIGLAMMKADVRKYVIALLTLSYIRKAPESTTAS